MRSTILAMKEEFESYFKERDEEISGALLAILAEEHILFLGPPGTAKTLLANKICDAIDGGDFFYYLLTRFSTPEEIFGPLSLKSLENDEFKRKTDGCLPTAHIALLDEIFKANSSILNSLLTILNERKFHNGTNVIKVPLLSVFGASNELPEEDENLEALYDRFLFRFNVEYIKNEKNLEELIFENVDDFSPSKKLTLEQMHDIRYKSKSLSIPIEVRSIIQDLRKELRLHDITISDRRWKKIVNTLKVAAVASGFDDLDKTTLMLLQHMLWDLPEQKETIRKMVINSIVSNGVNSNKLKNDLADLADILEKQNITGTSNNSNSKPTDFPYGIEITCDNCDAKIHSIQELVNHDKTHIFRESRPGVTYLSDPRKTYDELITYLKQHCNFTIEGNNYSKEHRIFINELSSLKSNYHQLKSSLIDEKSSLENGLSNNVWISFHDKNEILLKHEDKLKELYELEKSINELSEQLHDSPAIETDAIPAKKTGSLYFESRKERIQKSRQKQKTPTNNLEDPSLKDIRKEIDRLEFAQQTEVLTTNRERELVNKITELKKQYVLRKEELENNNDDCGLGALF